MSYIDKLEEDARNAAAANIFSHMASEERANKLYNEIQALPDAVLDDMAKISGVPESQLHIHRAMIRGEKNIFMDELEKVDGLLQTGDVILMAGTNAVAKALVAAQKGIYLRAKSSHVALVHADFVSIDAMPKQGVSNRIISEVLSGVEKDWRVIRYKKLQPKELDVIARACVFYMAQPYKIRPTKKSARKFSYCSELARKVYKLSEIKETGIPNNLVIKPADFDKLADEHHQWEDVTEKVRPAIDFCSTYPELMNVAMKLFIDGLKLNRKRFEERTDMLSKVRAGAREGTIQKDAALKIVRDIKAAEQSLNHKFWDVTDRD